LNEAHCDKLGQLEVPGIALHRGPAEASLRSSTRTENITNDFSDRIISRMLTKTNSEVHSREGGITLEEGHTYRAQCTIRGIENQRIFYLA